MKSSVKTVKLRQALLKRYADILDLSLPDALKSPFVRELVKKNLVGTVLIDTNSKSIVSLQNEEQ